MSVWIILKSLQQLQFPLQGWTELHFWLLFCFYLQKTEFSKRYRSLQRKVSWIRFVIIMDLECTKYVNALFTIFCCRKICREESYQRGKSQRYLIVLYFTIILESFMITVTLCSHFLAEPAVSDFPMDGEFMFPSHNWNIIQGLLSGCEEHVVLNCTEAYCTVLSCDSLHRWHALLPVFLCGRGWGPVSILRLLTTVDLKLHFESSLQFTI